MFISFDTVIRDDLAVKSSVMNGNIMMVFFDIKTKGFSLKFFSSETAAASYLEILVNRGNYTA